MEVKSVIKKAFVYIVIICLGILAGAHMRGTASATAPSGEEIGAQIRNGQPAPMVPNEQWSYCVPDRVATYTTRMHIRCAAAINGIYFFAVPISDSKHAARMLATMLTAQAAGLPTRVLFDPDDTSNLPPGCLETDCRLLLAIEID